MQRHDASTESEAPAEVGEGVAGEQQLQAGHTVGGGRFRLERAIGRGGMGMVWLAFDERLHEPVALKFLSEKIRGNPAALVAMRRETSRSHSLSHPQIVRTHDLYEGEGEPAFISMEYVDGSNLDQLAREREKRAFPWEQVMEWLRPLCNALDYAHSRGVIHRDLKPANIMLSSKRELKLADFGLADVLKDRSDSGDKLTGGTLCYMSPQQLSGAECAVTDDVYSLGACIFELLSGVPLFSGPGVRERIGFEPAPSLFETLEERGIPHSIPEEVDDVVLQCLSKDPQRRPPSAGALLASLGVSTEDKRVRAPDPASTKFPHAFWARKFNGRATARVALFVSLVVVPVLIFNRLGNRLVRKPGLDLRAAPVRASSVEMSPLGFTNAFVPEKAFDGVHRVTVSNHGSNDQHRWVSAPFLGDHEDWIAVDLGVDMRIEQVAIDWELAYAGNYTVRTRTSANGFHDNPSRWSVVGEVKGFRESKAASVDAHANIDDVVFDFENGRVHIAAGMAADKAHIKTRSPVARHIMVNCTARGRNPGVYSIHEITVAAKPSGAGP